MKKQFCGRGAKKHANVHFSCVLHVVYASVVCVLVFSKTDKCRTFLSEVLRLKNSNNNNKIRRKKNSGSVTRLSQKFPIEETYECSMGPELLSSENRFR